MPRFVLRLLQLVHLPCALGIALLAIVAALGFSFPVFDALNEVQPILFLGTLLALITVPLVYRGFHVRSFMLAAVATGFMASALIVVPEAMAGLVSRAEAPDQPAREYTLLSYNIFGRNYAMEEVAAMILNEDPDIVTLQEYFDEQRAPLHPLLVAHYPYFAFCDGTKRAHIALYSRIPFDLAADGACDSTDAGRTVRLVAEMQDEGSSFTVMTTHLDWPIQISRFRDGAHFIDGLYLTAERKQNEYEELRQAVSEVSGPLLLAGDFNSTPWSYAMRGFTRASLLTRQTRNLWTFPAQFFYFGDWRPALPFLPLDQVMTRGGIFVHDVKTGPATGSDHLPVITQFSIPLQAN